MDMHDIARQGVIDFSKHGPVSDACAQVTTLIRDHGWELQNVEFNAQIGEGEPVCLRLTLANRDGGAWPPDFGYRISQPVTKPV